METFNTINHLLCIFSAGSTLLITFVALLVVAINWSVDRETTSVSLNLMKEITTSKALKGVNNLIYGSNILHADISSLNSPSCKMTTICLQVVITTSVVRGTHTWFVVLLGVDTFSPSLKTSCVAVVATANYAFIVLMVPWTETLIDSLFDLSPGRTDILK